MSLAKEREVRGFSPSKLNVRSGETTHNSFALTSDWVIVGQHSIEVAAKCCNQAFSFATENLDTIGLPLTPKLAENIR